MGNTIKQYAIGFILPPIIFWVALLLISTIVGFVEWQQPLQFFGEYIKRWIDAGDIGEQIRMLLIINIIWTFVYVKAYNYLKY